MEDKTLYEAANEMKEKDFLQIGTAFDSTVRIYITKTTHVCQEAQKIHDMMATSAAALGRSLTATLMMGSMLKGDQTLAVSIDGNGPIGKICCEADSSGKVMGYVSNPGVYLKYNSGHLAVGLGVGTDGFLTVVKDLHLKEPFTSSVPLVTGEIAEDFTYYFAESEQVPSSVSLGVLVGLNGDILAAGGFIVQIMPNCKDETISLIEENLKNIPSSSELVVSGKSPREIAKMIIGENEYKTLKTINVKFECRCSKDKFRNGIKSLGYKTVKQLLDEDGGAEATCQYCHKAYEFAKEDLESILKEIKPQS